MFFKKMPHLRRLGIQILLNADQVIFLSNSYKKKCIENYIPTKYKDMLEKKSKIIPNGVNEFWFKNKSKSLKVKNDKVIKLIFVGNDSKRKNLKMLIKSCQILIEKNYNIELVVIGGFSNSFIMNELDGLSFVKIIGRVNMQELLFYYRNSDIFVLPSLIETFGLVYVEAMTQGLPVIYTKGQGFDEQYENGQVGYSVDSKDPFDIADKILKVSQNFNELAGRVLNLVDKFNWNCIRYKYYNIYNDINQRNINQ